MATIEFVFNRTPGRLSEFIKKLQSVGVPEKIGTEYPKSLGFGSSHARGFHSVLKQAGLLDDAGRPNDAYKKGLRGGPQGRRLVADAIRTGYKPLFDTYPDAATRDEQDLITFVKSHSSLNDENAGLVVKTFKTLCAFGDFAGGAHADPSESGQDSNAAGNADASREVRRDSATAPGLVINVNIALSVDATSDSAVYDAFFAAMAKHLSALADGN